MDHVKKAIKAYESWVAANPETVGDLETTTKWVSYFVAGRISNSNILSELVYSMSNILVLYNDRIINQGKSLQQQIVKRPDIERLKVTLTTLEYCEVFIEISAKRVFGTKGKWVVVVLLQLAKAAGRFFILKHSTEQIITSPTIPNLNRRALIKQRKENGGVNINHEVEMEPPLSQAGPAEENSCTFQLRRSGRVLRKVEGAPPMHLRDFKMFAADSSSSSSKIPSAILHAEYLYIAKPIVHLAAMGLFGEKRWKQFIIALSMDLISIRLYHKNRHLMTKEQKLELSRRCINLVMYLMRSPLYERITQNRLESVLSFIADNVPIVKMVAGPLREYLPHWQSTYFYLWST